MCSSDLRFDGRKLAGGIRRHRRRRRRLLRRRHRFELQDERADRDVVTWADRTNPLHQFTIDQGAIRAAEVLDVDHAALLKHYAVTSRNAVTVKSQLAGRVATDLDALAGHHFGAFEGAIAHDEDLQDEQKNPVIANSHSERVHG